LRDQSKRINFLNKTLKKGWYNSKVQSELGKRGGKKGGARNTTEQWQARSQVGRTYGRITGLANQSDKLRNILLNTFVFIHKEAKDEIFLVPSQESVIDIARFINEQCKERNLTHLKLDLEKIKSGGPFYQLIKQTKKSAYGWLILETFSLDEFDD
jgi:hypothetical protein